MEFCANCGSTLTWTLELFPDGRGVAGGSFDDPSWLNIERHVWARSKQHWVPIPAEAERFEKSALRSLPCLGVEALLEEFQQAARGAAQVAVAPVDHADRQLRGQRRHGQAPQAAGAQLFVHPA